MSETQQPIDLDSLRGTVAVVTGAGNNGIGWGLCTHAAGVLGMHVVAVDLHQTLVDQAARRLAETCPEVQSLGLQCDVTKPDQVEALVAKIRATWPDLRIGAVFANAGVIFNQTILRSTWEEWFTTLNVNVLGVVNTVKAFVPVLQEQGTPAIMCNTASVAGLARGDGGGAAYQASKHAVVALTESLSFELVNSAPQLQVHVLCPCWVESALDRTSRTNLQAAADSSTEVRQYKPRSSSMAMTTENHARQVFDQIAAGKFYVITDNVRPYVDHDFPFTGMALIKERMDNLLQQRIDNSDALGSGPAGIRSAILKGPMYLELQRRREARAKDKETET